MMKNTHIFFVEDDLPFGNVLKSFFELNDYDVTWCSDGQKAIENFQPFTYELAIIDVMLPFVDGFRVAEYIRDKDSAIPLVFLTAKTMKEDILRGYKTGADDYITKPFDTEVLLMKIEAILKRGNRTASDHKSVYKLGDYSFEPAKRELSHPVFSVRLSPRESELLELLIANLNILITRNELLKKLWGDDDYFSGRSMDVFITRLRKYLKHDETIELQSIPRSGYILVHNKSL